ncbi:MAG: hydrogenase iron-sulfur subunit [Bacteroidetes bacterium]|nr:MAG: hydrogenase iron-sulfur subunit [Bacteroidota bacterium]
MEKKAPKILVFSTEKISDPAIDLAGLLKLHYPPIVLTVEVPCSSAVKSKWILHAFDQGFDGVFIAADGTDCAYDESCTEKTGQIISQTHKLMKEKGILPEKLKMAAICSVCAESFVKQMNVFADHLSEQ